MNLKALALLFAVSSCASAPAYAQVVVDDVPFETLATEALTLQLPNPDPAAAHRAAIDRMQEQMLYPVVRVSDAYSYGTGSVLESTRKGGVWDTYILTAYHIVDTAMGPDPRMSVRFYQYEDDSTVDRTQQAAARVVATDPARDLALLQLVDPEIHSEFAVRLQSRGEVPEIFEPVWAVGSGSSFDPFPTQGVVSQHNIVSNGQFLTMINAPIISGNSGGPVYSLAQDGNYEQIGIAIGVWRKDSIGIVPHMAFMVPVDEARDFLVENCFGFLVDEPNADSCKPVHHYPG